MTDGGEGRDAVPGNLAKTGPTGGSGDLDNRSTH